MFDLKTFRKERKLKQSDVAKTTGLDRSRISKYETGNDVTDYVSEVLLKHYPEIGNFEININDISGQEISNDDLLAFLKSKESEQAERVKELKKMINILENVMEAKEEKIQNLEAVINELQKT